ncbi:hypothetical protein CEXT_407971 [Caerostris extrusa]|uniref:Uncharacterized protein n=1 Tax=Caerostris extrusa TaxID=172846 RepID=A0AAV4PN81_CAEEX|nr:hypothetical protein CEXT_407971 [Caerostris extrusa]
MNTMTIELELMEVSSKNGMFWRTVLMFSFLGERSVFMENRALCDSWTIPRRKGTDVHDDRFSKRFPIMDARAAWFNFCATSNDTVPRRMEELFFVIF